MVRFQRAFPKLYTMRQERANFKGNWAADLRNDNVYTNVDRVAMVEITGKQSRQGLDYAILSNDKIVNVVSKRYALLKNEDFFLKVEERFIQEDIQVATKSINRGDGSFAVDYILNDESFIIKAKNAKDILRPMLRAVNSYDGSAKTSMQWGFFRQICTNGLHIADTKTGFSVRHIGDMAEAVIPRIDEMIELFISNEYYELQRKFEWLTQRPISDVQQFVNQVLEDTKLFRFDVSDKNPEPSKRSQRVMEIIHNEAQLLGEQPNMWLGYNAFNEVLANDLKKTFDQERSLDQRLFNTIYELN